MKNRPREVEDGKAEPLRYAKASVPHLRSIMRSLVNNPEKGRETGRKARQWIVDHFSQQKLGDMVIGRLKEVEKIIIQQITLLTVFIDFCDKNRQHMSQGQKGRISPGRGSPRT